jgi:iodothyronine deiodinase-like protein
VLNKLYQQYKDRVAFYVIYILEAHASNVWQMESNVKQGVVFAMPKSIAERETVADSCVRNLHIQIPALVDDFSDSTEKAYTGWPDRLYVIDREGKVAMKTSAGPFGFHPDEVERTLKVSGF